MSDIERERLRAIKTFPSLVKYLRDELDWPLESEDFDDLTFDYEPEELGLDPSIAAKIEEIKQLRPLVSNQPWGIFFIKFEPKHLPVVVLRRILGQLVFKKRSSAKRSEQASWQLNDLLFISAYGEGEQRQINLAHFAENRESGGLSTLKVLGWDDADRDLKIDYVRHEMQEKLQWPENPSDLEKWRTMWASVFTLQHREVITTSKMLAEQLAELATAVRDRVNKVLLFEQETGPLRKLLKAFREILVHDLSEDGFCDMYAQTISYGLLSEKFMPKRHEGGSLGLGSLKVMNPFLGELVDGCRTIGRKRGLIDFDELGVGDVEDLLNDPNTKYADILRDFDNRNPIEDPVIHFYEHFLREYDAKQRVQRGVFFTPKPVVSFIVRSVDEILRTEFGLSDGLADTTTWGEMLKLHPDMELPEYVSESDPFIQILDPATGTGTFLVEVIDVIYRTMTAKWEKEGYMPLEFSRLWNDYVPQYLLPRLYGFEIMMAPYAIAHMKISLKLLETGYRFDSDERARIFLTNTLEPPQDFSGMFEVMAPAIAHEANAASKIKTEAPITIIIGNPPYSVNSANRNEYAEGLIRPYLEDLHERYVKPLHDDYVKFIAYVQGKFSKSVPVAFGMITNNGFLSGIIHRKMRASLLESFSSFYIIDLHGNLLIGDKDREGTPDQNVFDIRQGVSIMVAANNPIKRDNKQVFIKDLYGGRKSKYEWLSRNTANKCEFEQIIPKSDKYFLTSTTFSHEDEYSSFHSTRDLYNISSIGILTNRDWLVIDFTLDELLSKLQFFYSADISESMLMRRFPELNKGGWWDYRVVRSIVMNESQIRKNITKIMYRPFDVRYIFLNSRLVNRPRLEVMEHMNQPNIALVVSRITKNKCFDACFVSKYPVEQKCAESTRGVYCLPIFLYGVNRGLINESYKQSNISDERIPHILEDFDDANDKTGFQGQDVLPEKILGYIYAVLYAPSYRERYENSLKIDFPRIPGTSNSVLFQKLSSLGADLVALHLLEDDYPTASWNTSRGGNNPLAIPITRFIDKGGAQIGKSKLKYKDGKVFINTDSYFEDVPEGVWNFCIGGYHVCEKWLKGRQGRMLLTEDITHFHKIVVALNETIRLMREIDHIIEEHGGWPGAFVTD